MTRAQYIETYQSLARQITQGTGVFPETVLAAGAVESRNGESQLATKANNHFGIKAGSSWTGQVVTMRTREVNNGQDVYVNAKFRAYPSVAKSYQDYVRLLATADRYKPALQASSWQDQIVKLSAAGYATDPQYANILLSVGRSISKALALGSPSNLLQVGITIGLLLMANNQSNE